MTMRSVPYHCNPLPAVTFGVRQNRGPDIGQVLEKLLAGYERRVPESGQFPAGYEVPFRYRGHQVLFKVGGFMSDPEFFDRRYFEVLVHSISGQSTSKAWLYRGSKKEIEEQLRSPETARQLKTHIEDAIASLTDKKYS